MYKPSRVAGSVVAPGVRLGRVAGATIAGHLIECGTQVTGGISTDWLSVPDNGNIGFPIVEISEDGSCIVTKPASSAVRFCTDIAFLLSCM